MLYVGLVANRCYVVCRLGMASFVLETIPFVSIVFSFTNAVGAALWASDIEKAIQ